MTKYFVIPPTVGVGKKFAIVERGAVVRVDVSRPDGEEIERPPGIAWRVRQIDFTSVVTPRYHFNNGVPTRK